MPDAPKFDPGPWHIELMANSTNLYQVYAINQDAKRDGVTDFIVIAEYLTLANARLIAAAPELSAACLEALRVINSYTAEPIPAGVYNRVTRMLSDAIVKGAKL